MIGWLMSRLICLITGYKSYLPLDAPGKNIYPGSTSGLFQPP